MPITSAELLARAAALDLLAACKAVISSLETLSPSIAECEVLLRAAIAKAEGKP